MKKSEESSTRWLFVVTFKSLYKLISFTVYATCSCILPGRKERWSPFWCQRLIMCIKRLCNFMLVRFCLQKNVNQPSDFWVIDSEPIRAQGIIVKYSRKRYYMICHFSQISISFSFVKRTKTKIMRCDIRPTWLDFEQKCCDLEQKKENSWINHTTES